MTSCLLGELVDEIIPRWCGEEDHGIDGLPRGSTCHVSLGGDAAARLRCERLEEDARGMAAESEVEDRRPVCQLSGWCLSFQPEVEHQYLCDSALHARTVCWHIRGFSLRLFHSGACLLSRWTDLCFAGFYPTSGGHSV